MKKKNLAQLVGTLSVIVVVVLGVFLMLNSQEDDGIFAKEKEKNTEVQNILSKDLDRNYPATVREVVRLYARISRCYHNEVMSETEFKNLVEFQRKIFDEEFLENNPLDTFTKNLQAEIEAAKGRKYSMVTYRVQKESSAENWQSGEDNFASIVASFTMKDKEATTRTYEEFLLRKDENERWKIVGWRLTDPIEIED